MNTASGGVQGPVGGSTYRVVALVPNLMDRGRVEAALLAAGATVEFVASASQLAEAGGGAQLAVVDLTVPLVMVAVASLSAAGTPTFGFGSHVDRELLRRARASGCNDVVPRSAVAHRLALIVAAGVAGVAGRAASDTAPGGRSPGR